jgi:N-acetylneuraminate synthase
LKKKSMEVNNTMKTVKIGKKSVGKNHPAYIVAEIGINHNGDLECAKKLIDAAYISGCDAVKFQKRDPAFCVPPEQRTMIRETPWGNMTYMDYRYRLEFGAKVYKKIDEYCKKKKIDWFASCWDIPSVDFIEKYSPVCYKIASASLTDDTLLKHINSMGRPIILSTGMSTMDEIRHAISLLDKKRLILLHSTSSYPCKKEELNLSMIKTLMNEFDNPIGYSGHEVGLQTTLAARVMGACLLERHITLDRAMWGSDQAASIEPGGLIRLVRDIRIIEMAVGDGNKRIYDSELPLIQRLRNIKNKI